MALVLVALVLAVGGVVWGLGGDDTADAQGLTVSDAWTAPNRETAAVYLTIDNGGPDDRLVGATAEIAGTASLMGADSDVAHEADDVEAIDLAIPQGLSDLHPGGGRHLMLQDLTRELAPGDRFRLQLEFDHAGPVTATVEVRAG